MDASSTKRKSNNDQDLPTTITKNQFDQLVNITAEYITKWTQIELKRISQDSKLPVCWPIPGGGYHIGHDRILPDSGAWRRHDSHREISQLFAEKQSAIFYSLLMQIGYPKIADKIAKYDNEVLKLESNIVYYNRGLENAIKNKDSAKIHIQGSRLDDARLRLRIAKEHLQKTLKMAKYLKVWDL